MAGAADETLEDCATLAALPASGKAPGARLNEAIAERASQGGDSAAVGAVVHAFGWS